MKKILSVFIIFVLFFLIGCRHEHSFTEASCTSPKTCSECGETEGEILPHDFSEASCTSPKICKNCGLTEGEALGHTFADATCTEPSTCLICGNTNGEALGHKESEWITRDYDLTSGTYVNYKTCSVCFEETQTELITMDTFVDHDDFVFNMAQFYNNMMPVIRSLPHNLDTYYDFGSSSNDEAFVNIVDKNTISICLTIFFFDDNTPLTLEDFPILDPNEEARLFNHVGIVYDKDADFIKDCLAEIILLFDPQLEKDPAEQILDALNETDAFLELNGVYYKKVGDDGLMISSKLPND